MNPIILIKQLNFLNWEENFKSFMKPHKYTYIFSVIGMSLLVFALLIFSFKTKISLKANNKVSEQSTSESLPSSPLPTENSDLKTDIIGIWVPYLDLEIHSPDNTEKVFKNKF